MLKLINSGINVAQLLKHAPKPSQTIPNHPKPSLSTPTIQCFHRHLGSCLQETARPFQFQTNLARDFTTSSNSRMVSSHKWTTVCGGSSNHGCGNREAAPLPPKLAFQLSIPCVRRSEGGCFEWFIKRRGAEGGRTTPPMNQFPLYYWMHGNIWGPQTFPKWRWWALWSWNLCVQKLFQKHVGHRFPCVLPSDLFIDFPIIGKTFLHMQLLFSNHVGHGWCCGWSVFLIEHIVGYRQHGQQNSIVWRGF